MTNKIKRIYIAGPMTSYENFNYPAFHQAAATLRGFGYHVENPAENNLPANTEWADYMKSAIPKMLTCDTVVFLKDWETSKGANLEFYIARKLGLNLFYFDNLINRLTEHCERL